MRRQFRVSGDFYCAPEVVAAGNTVIGLWSLAGAWVAAQESAELEPVPVSVLRWWQKDPRPTADRLVTLGLWEEIPAQEDDDEVAWAFVERDGLYQFQGIRHRPAIDQALRDRVYARDGHACLHCGAAEKLSLDHIYPWSLGGPDTFENLQTLCTRCNSSKGARV